MKKIWLIFGLLVFTFTLTDVWAKKEIPKAPYYYVLDEPQVLSAPVRERVQSLLIEHDQLTGEQIVVAIFKSLDGEELVDFSNRVFEAWAIGKRGKDNGVLLALYWDDRKARIEVGYGLEPLLTDAESKGVIENQLIPALKDKDPDSGVVASIYEILETIGSPLIQDGKADQRLNVVRRGAQKSSPGLLVFFLIIALMIIVRVINYFTKAEAHFTRSGWYRPNPFRRGGGGFGGFGGFGGGGGGFGGFGGGGGRSGGGGASGSW